MGGLVYHVLNRAVGRGQLFEEEPDYAAFERVLAEAVRRISTRVVCYCLMPNHWHMVLWPRADDELSEFMRWLTVTHTQRWHAHRRTAGTGPVYQGRFKSFPIQQDYHFLRSAVTWSGMLSAHPWCIERRSGGGAASGGD
jgi:putative transposase